MYWNDQYVGNLHIVQFLYENIFNIAFCIIEFNILAGIIISNYGALRVMNDSNLEDQREKCFICGISKDEIEEKTKKPFRYHRKYEHSEWNYIFFILYTRSKPSSEFSGIETLVDQAVRKGEIDWIPQGRGFSLMK